MHVFLARLRAMYGLQSRLGARVLLDQGSAPGASAAETYQNLRRESSERFPRPPRFAARPWTLPPVSRLALVDFAFLLALVLRAIVRSTWSERAHQAAPNERAA